MPEGKAKSEQAPIRRPPFSAEGHCTRAHPGAFLFGPCTARFSFGKTDKGSRRAPHGGERRSAQAHGVGAEVPLGCKGAGAVFALGSPPRPAWWGESEQRSERVLASMAGTRDAELVTARETEPSGLCGDEVSRAPPLPSVLTAAFLRGESGGGGFYAALRAHEPGGACKTRFRFKSHQKATNALAASTRALRSSEVEGSQNVPPSMLGTAPTRGPA